MRILVTGSRDWPYRQVVYRELELLCKQAYLIHDSLTVVEGACPTGADDDAYQWVLTHPAFGHGIYSERYPADWTKYGKAAGPIRNQQMVDLKADLCLGFRLNGSHGTTDCLERARVAGIPRRIIDLTITGEAA